MLFLQKLYRWKWKVCYNKKIFRLKRNILERVIKFGVKTLGNGGYTVKRWKFWKKEPIQEEQDEMDALLYKYMPKYEEKLMADLESKIDYSYEFSDEYRRKMERLIRKEPRIVPMRILKRVAVGIAVFLLTFSLSMYWGVKQCNAQWLKLYETIKTIWEDSFLYSYFIENAIDTGLPTVYEPKYIPEGYELVRKTENTRVRVFVYEQDNKQLKLKQLIIGDADEAIIDSEFIQQKTIKVYGMEISLYYYADGKISSYCEYLDSIFIIDTSALTQDEIVNIYEGWIQ